MCATNSVLRGELTHQNKSTSQSPRLASTIKPGESEMTCLFRAIKCLTSSWPVIYLISLPVHLSHDFCQTPHQHAGSIGCLSSYVKVNNECLWRLSGAFECGQLVWSLLNLMVILLWFNQKILKWASLTGRLHCGLRALACFLPGF